MKLKLLLTIVIQFVFSFNNYATIRYVKNTASGTGDGSSWSNASNDLQLMIDQSSANDEVWVAVGWYRPIRLHYNTATISIGNRDNSFVMKADVKIYGGFSGNETDLSQRMWQNNQTVLNGDIGTPDNSSDNCYSVVRSMGNAGTALLDGFYIEKGNGDGAAGNQQHGGGIYIFQGSPVISNCVITDNKAYAGGGIFIQEGAPLISDCDIYANIAATEGGAVQGYIPGPYTLERCWVAGNSAYRGGAVANLYFQGAGNSINIRNCLMQGNYASASSTGMGGGAVYNYSGDGPVEYVNCTIAGNRTMGVGGAINNNQSPSDVLKNCIVWGNVGESGNANFYAGSNAALLSNCITEGGWSGTGNSGSNPAFRYPGAAPDAPTTGGDYHVLLCSPAINAGDNSLLLPTDVYDVSGNVRTQDAAVDIGAYEHTPVTIIPDANGRVYVNKNNINPGDGSSWLNACRELADVVHAAQANPAISEVWVAAGIYLPLYDATTGCAGTDIRNRSFVMPTGTFRMYGGFAGNESTLAQRDWITNETILSGDLGAPLTAADNAYQIIRINSSNATEIDGFSIRYANSDPGGGAINASVTNLSVRNCIIGNNHAGTSVLSFNSANVSVENCSFMQNTSTGTIITAAFGAVQVRASKFSGNQATQFLVMTAANPTHIKNSLFSGNLINETAPQSSGLFYAGSSANMLLTGCTIAQNSIDAGCLFKAQSSSAITANNGVIWNNSANEYVSVDGSSAYQANDCIAPSSAYGSNNVMADPEFRLNGAGAAPFITGDYRLQRCSPAINTGNAAHISSDDTLDIAGSSRVSEGGADKGAYEFSGARPDANGIVYVDSAVATSGDGSSWSNAVNELADALRAAKSDAAIHEVWVAKGTYQPLYTADSMLCNTIDLRKKSFVMPDGLRLYGGFVPGATSVQDRDWNIHPVLLDGESGVPGNRTDNVYHVVVAAGITDTATRIDGFTIRNGYGSGDCGSWSNYLMINGEQFCTAQGSAIANIGGGAGCSVYNCTIEDNYGEDLHSGGAVYNSLCSPVIARCRIINNKNAMGGGIYNRQSAAKIRNCVIAGNTAYSGGGVVIAVDSVTILESCIISGNVSTYADIGGGGVFITSGSQAQVVNCTITGNRANNRGGGIFIDGSSHPLIANSIVFHNQSGTGENEIDTMIDCHPVVTDCIVKGGYTYGLRIIPDHPSFVATIHPANAPTTTGDFHLSKCSPAINMGNNTLVNTAVDIDGGVRIAQDRVDIGAYEEDGLLLSTIPGDSIATVNFNNSCAYTNADFNPLMNWNMFYSASDDHLILGMQDSNTVFANSNMFPLVTSQKLTNDYGSGNVAELENPFGQTGYYYPVNRSWTISANQLLPAPVRLRFYISEQDSLDLASQVNFGSLQNLVVYKVDGNNAYDLSAGGYRQYVFGSVADTSHFTIGTYQNIKYVEFVVTGFSSGGIAYISSTPLNILLGDISAANEGRRNRVQWNTMDEMEGDAFVLEHSADGKVFEQVHQVLANGTPSHYTYFDEQPFEGITFYRLKMMNADGSREYSKVVSAMMKGGEHNIHIYPNPVEDVLTIRFEHAGNADRVVLLMDITGRILVRKPVIGIEMSFGMEQYPAGPYLVKVEELAGSRYFKVQKK